MHAGAGGLSSTAALFANHTSANESAAKHAQNPSPQTDRNTRQLHQLVQTVTDKLSSSDTKTLPRAHLARNPSTDPVHKTCTTAALHSGNNIARGRPHSSWLA